MHMNNVWSEEEQSSFSDLDIQPTLDTIKIATVTPVEKTADDTQNVCPVHGLQNVFDANMIDGNDSVISLQAIVKTYLLSSEYPHDISLDMINRFCSAPLKRLVVKIAVLEPGKTAPLDTQ